MSIYQNRLAVSLVTATLYLAAQQPSFAGSATWSSNPINNQWTTSQNWMPNTVPDSAGDTASFATSNMTELNLTGLLQIAGMNFSSRASSYSITVKAASTLGTTLSIMGFGITNASGKLQTFLTENNDPFGAVIFFFNSASAGEMTSFVGVGGEFNFRDASSAASASFDVSNIGSFVGEVNFGDNSTAADSIISVHDRGNAVFDGTATAANAVITATSIGMCSLAPPAAPETPSLA